MLFPPEDPHPQSIGGDLVDNALAYGFAAVAPVYDARGIHCGWAVRFRPNGMWRCAETLARAMHVAQEDQQREPRDPQQ